VEKGITHRTVRIGGLLREPGEYLRMIDRLRLSPNYSRLATETELLDLYIRG
jgi:hypothetical protein